MNVRIILFFSVATFYSFSLTAQESPRLEAVRTIIKAVNTKKPKLYVSVFSEEAQVFIEGDLKLDSKEALLENRTAHLKKHPLAKSEIQHLVEIDNKVIMHDRVWLKGAQSTGQDIVEIFTFDRQGKIMRVDVIQPKNLFNANAK